MKKLVLLVSLIFATSIFAQAMQPPQQPPQRMSLDVEIMNQVLKYLSTQPFNEVNGLIGQIQKDGKILEPKAKKPAPKPEPKKAVEPAE